MKLIVPLDRGDLEISDLINSYMREDTLKLTRLERGSVRLDTGACEDLHNASSYRQTLVKKQCVSIGNPDGYI